MLCVFTEVMAEALYTNSVDSDQTAPVVCLYSYVK